MSSQNVSLPSVRVNQFLKFIALKPPDDGSQMSQSQAASQQPSAELLASLGIQVRDFAYENILPAINPVPRVPRQVQPTPLPKRPQSDCDAIPEATSEPGAKKPRILDRRPTEPLQEPPVQHTRTLGRITLTRVCSIIIPSPRRTLPPAPHTRFSASPPASPLTPLLSHLASQDSQLIQTPPAFPFVVHVDDTSLIPASQIDSESQSASFHPTLYSRLTCSSLRCSPAPSPQNPSPTPLSSPFLELSSPKKDLEANPRVRKRRNRGIAAGTIPSSSPYQLRQRPVSSSALLRRSRQAPTKSLPRRLMR